MMMTLFMMMIFLMFELTIYVTVATGVNIYNDDDDDNDVLMMSQRTVDVIVATGVLRAK